jgi:hypothetical protein
MKKLNLAVSASMLLCICLAGCATKAAGPDAATLQARDQAKAQLESTEQIAAQTAQSYHAMDNPTLLTKLVEQSTAKKEPFNSLAYRELRGRTDVDPGSLAALVRANKNGNALLPLLLLRKQNEKAYLALPVELRAAVLTDALQNSSTFNTWGLPHLYMEDASHAMLEAGKSAYPALKRMLSDTRPAPVFGSQESMEYKKYQYRLCDYALWYIEEIQGTANFHMPLAVGDRDALIKGLMK